MRAQPTGFLDWPATPSLATLLSAACLLAGAWGLVAPTIGDPEQGWARLAVVGVLSAYAAALLGVVWALCRLEHGNHDGIAASVVLVAGTVGIGATLDLICVERPWATSALAAGGLIAAFAGWRRWDHATGGATPRELRGPLAVLLAWSFAAPAVMGLRLALVDDPSRAVHAMAIWLPGWWLVLLAGTVALLALALGAAAWSDRERPFLSRPAMRWVLLLVLLAACGAHQWVLGYSANLDFAWLDVLPLAALLALLGNELRAAAAGGDVPRDAAAVAGPAAAVAPLTWLGATAPAADDTLNRGEGALRLAVAITQSPVAIMLWLAAAAFALHALTRRPGLLAGAAFACAGAVLVRGAEHGAGVDAVGAAATLAIAGALWAVTARRWRMLLTAALAVEAAACALPALRPTLAAMHLSPVEGWILGAAATVMTAGSVLPWLVPRTPMRLAAWALAALSTLAALRLGATAAHATLAALAALACVLSWWRRGDLALLAPILLPAAAAAPHLMPRNKAWLGVWSAFALLGATIALSRLRLSRERRPHAETSRLAHAVNLYPKSEGPDRPL